MKILYPESTYLSPFIQKHTEIYKVESSARNFTVHETSDLLRANDRTKKKKKPIFLVLKIRFAREDDKVKKKTHLNINVWKEIYQLLVKQQRKMGKQHFFLGI